MNKDNIPNNIQSVIHRIKFIDMLYSNRVNFQGPLNYNLEYDFHPFQHFYSTINYLLLTCLDTLSEKEKFEDFDIWVKKENNLERDQILENFDSNKLNYKELTQNLYSKYKEKHGIVKSIRNFVFNELKTETRVKLFNSISVIKYSKIKGKEVKQEIIDDNKIFKYLLDVRNKFTHSAFIFAGWDDNSPMIGAPTNFMLWDGKIGNVSQNWTKVEQTKFTYKNVTLKGWPYIIREVLADYIYDKYKIDISLKTIKLKEYRGEYNFDLLWSEYDKILLAKREDGKNIFVGGSAFKSAKEAIYFMDCKVGDAIKLDNPSKYGIKSGDVYLLEFSKYKYLNPVNDLIGTVISESGKKYFVRYNKPERMFLFSQVFGSTWACREIEDTDYLTILDRALLAINDNEKAEGN
ncbi:hypothetical protein ESY86_20190 [Subsaximicrobium wynnwilliamsii]|uniref:Uncharacterized protein n=1 Tax=Subsaximicrobium wynnwilliamsii TaxID=291179 RepID=A0A5C6ZAG9_9FLAO|nr:hypothetical protein [Subsaximicrobium wynnwilliamsii]TXD80716.1 hypothetical protein ESY87_20295 [Subsaximicrobium wynnwilliamsii]TXD86437.1 hypothetical protein ESY86_20190 [Subsaximicrobium wynnwilliamsii]TXD99962.1 hypothetical protein ESY88_20240 [Subsaximicrobium wynnwilliamsii]